MTHRPRLSSIAPEAMFRWMPELFRLGGARLRGHVRLLGSAVVVGAVAGLAAVMFYAATRAVWALALGSIAGYAPASPAGEAELTFLHGLPAAQFRPWLLLLVPTVGGLISGMLVFTVAPEAEGHGTDAVVAAYHHHDGSIRPRVPLVKMIASALTIGTGGSGGREGPIAQIGAGFGSFLAGALRLRPADRRVLCAAGMGAGIAAIFRAPLAGALFASEVLYWSPEFEPEVIIPAGLASVVAYCTFGAFYGWQSLFAIPDLRFGSPIELAPYLLLAVFMAALAMLYTRSFYGLSRLFRRIPIPTSFKPALGALLAGTVGVALYLVFGSRVLAVLSFGYGALQGAMTDQAGMSVALLLAIALGKIATTSLTIGSGGSGGVFGPSMVIGGCGGGAFGILLHRFAPHLAPQPACYVVVGMAGFFAAAAKTPFSTLVIVSEMTGGYHLLLPALWVCAIAFVLSDRQSLYASQLETRSRSPAHRRTFVQALLAGATIRSFVRAPVTTIRPSDSLTTVIDKLTEAGLPALPVVDARERVIGCIHLDDVIGALQVASQPLVIAADLAREEATPLLPDDTIDVAQEHFVEEDVLALPVVDDPVRRHLVGMVKRFDVSSAYVRSVHGHPTYVRSG
jgi:CIC family chloride channel protein